MPSSPGNRFDLMNPRPLYLLDPGGVEPRLCGLVPGSEPERIDEVDDLRDRPPGLLLLPIELVPGERVLAALTIVAESPPASGWLPVLVDGLRAGDQVRAIPVSVGWPADPGELARWVAGADDADVLELRHVLTRVARGRHDLNNPLTAAMAETQLALLDAEDPALRQGLEAVEAQLRRIRDLVAGLRAFRPPRGAPDS